MRPAQQPLPYGRQWLDKTDIDAVVATLQSDWLTCGPKVEAFEHALCGYTGAQYAVAVCNGTAALHLALKAAGIGPGDRVITSANTFLASANAAEYNGAIADFADIDPQTLCLSLETLKEAWKPDVKAVVAVDFAGYPCVTQEMAAFIHSQGAIIIEDACHAIGGYQNGYRIGALPWVDLTTFSFHPVKTMTTGEGGAILTNNTDWAAACRCLRNHGMVHETTDQLERPYSMRKLGFNYRISDIHCALGINQLQKLDLFVERRRSIAASYSAALAKIAEPAVRPALPYPGQYEAWHLYACRTNPRHNRDALRAKLQEHGIGTQIHYYPVHLQPYYSQKYGYATGKCPQAEKWFTEGISLPLFPAMTDQDVQRVREVLHAIST